MIELPTMLVVLVAAATPAGSFRHDEWFGRCYRDGFMAGHVQEVCQARRNGIVAVTIVRRAGALTVRTLPRRCIIKLPPLIIPGSQLNGMRRDVVVVKAIEASARYALHRCHSRAGMPDLDTTALHAMMAETDDLEMGDE